MTAVEWYEIEINSLIKNYESQEISKREFITVKHNLFYQAKEMERQQKDDYAIEFYKWMIDNIHIFHELSIWNKEFKKYSEKEILEIFKKEKCY